MDALPGYACVSPCVVCEGGPQSFQACRNRHSRRPPAPDAAAWHGVPGHGTPGMAGCTLGVEWMEGQLTRPTAATREGSRLPAATSAPPTGTMKFLSVDCTTASTRPRRHAAVTYAYPHPNATPHNCSSIRYTNGAGDVTQRLI